MLVNNESTIAQIGPASTMYDAFQGIKNQLIGKNPGREHDIDRREKFRDLCSYNVGFFNNNDVIGGIRFSPLGHGLTFSELHSNILDHVSDPCGCLEANRLVLIKDYRRGDAAYSYLVKTLDWVEAETGCHTLIASSVNRFLGLYKRLGFSVIDGFDISGKQYNLIFKEIRNGRY